MDSNDHGRRGWMCWAVLAAAVAAWPAAARMPPEPTTPDLLADPPSLESPDDEDMDEVTPPPPRPNVSPDQVDVLRQAMVGKPVYGYRTGRVGTVVSLATNGRGQPAAVVVQLDPQVDPSQGYLPVLWQWAGGQANAPTLVVPWSAAQLRWLVRKED